MAAAAVRINKYNLIQILLMGAKIAHLAYQIVKYVKILNYVVNVRMAINYINI